MFGGQKFTDNGDGTITDAVGLQWEKQASGGQSGWYSADSHCTQLTLAGHSDWRLPAISELESIVDTKYSPTIDPVFFQYTLAEAYWSSTSESTDGAWGVDFKTGNTKIFIKISGPYVRCVREP